MVHYTSHPDHHTSVCGAPVTGHDPASTDPAQTECHLCRMTFAWRIGAENTVVLGAIQAGADTAAAITAATSFAVGIATLVLHRLQMVGIIATIDGRAVIKERN